MTTGRLFLMATTCLLACPSAASPPPALRGKADANVPGPAAAIDEITLERFGHGPAAPFYKIVFRKDGTATYAGQFNVARIGTFKAKIDPEDFRRLGELLHFAKNDDCPSLADP